MSGAGNDRPCLPLHYEFDWQEDIGDIVVSAQAAVAVYLNVNGSVVIRQEGHYGPDEDVWIVVEPGHVEELTRAMLIAAGIQTEPTALLLPPSRCEPELDLLTTKPKDSTAAERQRRYRNRKRDTERDNRDIDGDATVTHRDGDRDVTAVEP